MRFASLLGIAIPLYLQQPVGSHQFWVVIALALPGAPLPRGHKGTNPSASPLRKGLIPFWIVLVAVLGNRPASPNQRPA